jgi:hypothetical protein
VCKSRGLRAERTEGATAQGVRAEKAEKARTMGLIGLGDRQEQIGQIGARAEGRVGIARTEQGGEGMARTEQGQRRGWRKQGQRGQRKARM